MAQGVEHSPTNWSICLLSLQKILNPKLLPVSLPSLFTFIWMIIAPDEQVALCMVVFITSVWKLVCTLTCAVKCFEWSLRLERLYVSTVSLPLLKMSFCHGLTFSQFFKPVVPCCPLDWKCRFKTLPERSVHISYSLWLGHSHQACLCCELNPNTC